MTVSGEKLSYKLIFMHGILPFSYEYDEDLSR